MRPGFYQVRGSIADLSNTTDLSIDLEVLVNNFFYTPPSCCEQLMPLIFLLPLGFMEKKDATVHAGKQGAASDDFVRRLPMSQDTQGDRVAVT